MTFRQSDWVMAQYTTFAAEVVLEQWPCGHDGRLCATITAIDLQIEISTPDDRRQTMDDGTAPLSLSSIVLASAQFFF
jgi:hypothetical protein